MQQMDLEGILDLSEWEKLQDAIAIETQLAIILVDYRGKPVSTHNQIQPFCQLVRQHPKLSKYCEKCDARGALEAVRKGTPFIYRCHFDIVDIAIPIMVESHYMGAIMAGEVQMEENQDQLEQVLNADDQELIQWFKKEHQKAYEQLPKLSFQDMDKAAYMIGQLSKYILTEIVKKGYSVQKHEGNSIQISSKEFQPTNSATLELVSEEQEKINLSYQAKNSQLQPAIDAMYDSNRTVDLQYLAELTNLSPNYLSRLIKEEFGEPFTQVYNKLKVRRAKQQLRDTNKTINEISDDLGYVDASYFVRTFKKYVGTTPLNFRKSA